jgi:serine/threonine-protein kinase HipA
VKTAGNAITMAEVRLHPPRDNSPGQGEQGPITVGWLSQFGDNLRMSFAKSYLEDAGRCTLSQLYRGQTEADTRAILSAVSDERLVRIGRLPAFFGNLLPEGVNRERLAQQRGCQEEDELELLAAAGHDLSGAIEVVPAGDVPRSVLELHATLGLEPLEASAVAAPVEDGFSVDGFQTKFSMVHDGRRYTVRRGSAAGEFIAKLPSSRFPDLAANEATCYALAQAVGIETSNAELRPIKELDVPEHVKSTFDDFLLVRRFDRRRDAQGVTQRVHFEELTQALGHDSRQKYKDLARSMHALLVMLKFSDSPLRNQGLDDFFRRWTAFGLMGNTDAHAKNWGLIYPDGRNAVLAPAYDLVCVAAYFDPQRPNDLAQNRAMDRSLRGWSEDQAEQMAKAAGLLNFNRYRKIVRETRAQAAAQWPALLTPAPERVRETILARLGEMVQSRST